MSMPASSPLAAAGSPFMDEQARRELRDRKREAILLAAARLFNERGYHATSLDDVAAQLGISKPVVYHYLGNKERVLLECMHNGMTQLQEAAAKAKAHPGSGLDAWKSCWCATPRSPWPISAAA